MNTTTSSRCVKEVNRIYIEDDVGGRTVDELIPASIGATFQAVCGCAIGESCYWSR